MHFSMRKENNLPFHNHDKGEYIDDQERDKKTILYAASEK